jgi:hypothetical protein
LGDFWSVLAPHELLTEDILVSDNVSHGSDEERSWLTDEIFDHRFRPRKADYYNIEDRTSGMADFVFSSALGMTAGPAIAASLSIVAPPNQSQSNSYWTIETAPG